MSGAELVPGDYEAWRSLRGAVPTSRNVARLAVAGPLLDGLPLAVRPLHPDAATGAERWEAAACVGAPESTKVAMIAATRQVDAEELRWRCAGCPVRLRCLTAGRREHSYGLRGGLVLVCGAVAAAGREGTSGEPARMTEEPTSG